MGKYKIKKLGIPPLFSKKERKEPIQNVIRRVLKKNNKIMGFD